MKCSEQVNPQRHKIDKWITGVEGEVEWRVIAFLGGDENVLNLVVIGAQFWEYTQNHLILWCVNYISRKLF